MSKSFCLDGNQKLWINPDIIYKNDGIALETSICKI